MQYSSLIAALFLLSISQPGLAQENPQKLLELPPLLPDEYDGLSVSDETIPAQPDDLETPSVTTSPAVTSEEPAIPEAATMQEEASTPKENDPAGEAVGETTAEATSPVEDDEESPVQGDLQVETALEPPAELPEDTSSLPAPATAPTQALSGDWSHGSLMFTATEADALNQYTLAYLWNPGSTQLADAVASEDPLDPVLTSLPQESRPINIPVLAVSSIVYFGPNDWTVWINGHKFMPNKQPSLPRVEVTEISPQEVVLRWTPVNSGILPPTSSPAVVLDGSSVLVSLRPNQTFISSTMAVQEGRALTADIQGVLRQTNNEKVSADDKASAPKPREVSAERKNMNAMLEAYGQKKVQ